jgi:hypothetical protein
MINDNSDNVNANAELIAAQEHIQSELSYVNKLDRTGLDLLGGLVAVAQQSLAAHDGLDDIAHRLWEFTEFFCQ